IGDVRKRRGALVRSDHQIGIVAVVADDIDRGDDFVVDDVVGDVQQASDQRLIARDDFRLLRLAVGYAWAFDHETAFGAYRNDDGILYLLRLHQSENLGAEIFAPIGPADAAASDVSHPQVHAFHARREYEHLEQGLGQRQLAQFLAFHLEGQIVLELARLGRPVRIGAYRGGQGVPQGTQNAVLVRTRHFLQPYANALVEPRERAAPARRGQPRVEARHEKIGEGAGQSRVVDQHLRDVALAEGQARLQQVAAISEQHRHDSPRHAGRQRQLVEAVAVHASGPDGGERALEFTVQLVELDCRRSAHYEFQILDPGAPAAGEFQRVRPFCNDLETH